MGSETSQTMHSRILGKRPVPAIRPVRSGRPYAVTSSPHCCCRLPGYGFNPIERAGNGFLPLLVKFCASRIICRRFPGFVHAPVFPHFVGVLPEANGQAGGVGRAQELWFQLPWAE